MYNNTPASNLNPAVLIPEGIENYKQKLNHMTCAELFPELTRMEKLLEVETKLIPKKRKARGYNGDSDGDTYEVAICMMCISHIKGIIANKIYLIATNERTTKRNDLLWEQIPGEDPPPTKTVVKYTYILRVFGEAGSYYTTDEKFEIVDIAKAADLDAMEIYPKPGEVGTQFLELPLKIEGREGLYYNE